MQVESTSLLVKKMSTTGQYVTFTFSVTDLIFTLVDWIWMMINSLQSAPSFDTHATNQILNGSGQECCKILQMTVYFLNMEYVKVFVSILCCLPVHQQFLGYKSLYPFLKLQYNFLAKFWFDTITSHTMWFTSYFPTNKLILATNVYSTTTPRLSYLFPTWTLSHK